MMRLAAGLALLFGLIGSAPALAEVDGSVGAPPPIERTELIDTFAAIPAYVIEALGPADCYVEESIGPESAKKYVIASAVHLWAVPCIVGAYQAAWSYVIAEQWNDGWLANIVDFPGPPGRSITPEFTIISPEFDPLTGRLVSYAKGRGLGDCGVFSRYFLRSVEGEIVIWELQEYRQKEDCDGVYVDPEDYPLVYEAF